MKALLFGASRVFGESAEGYRWAQDQIARLMLGRYELLLTSATPGPEVWAEATALRWGLPVIVFHADGRRTDSRGKGPARWAPENIKASSRQRDEALAQAAAKAVRAGWSLTIVGLLDATEGVRSGTGYRFGLLEEAGLQTHKIFWGQQVTVDGDQDPPELTISHHLTEGAAA